jgi:hypothetical protein
MNRCSLKKLKGVESIEHCRVTISNMLADLEKTGDDVDLNRDLATIRYNITFSAKESLAYCGLKQRSPRFAEVCSQL